MIDRSGVKQIAVFRALMVGDFLCSVPALRALKAGFPAARLTLVGLSWNASLAARFGLIDDFIAFPGFPGLPEVPPQLDALPAFFEAVQQRRFDLAVQLHGSGPLVNSLVAAFDARHTAGFTLPGIYCAEPSLHLDWPADGHEIDRLLKLPEHLGCPAQSRALEFPVTDPERLRTDALLSKYGCDARFICIHPGAQLPSRRWPVERFAALADRLAERGYRIVITGTQSELAPTQRLGRLMRWPSISLVGMTDWGMLGAVLERCALLIANDTGVSHIAAALQRFSVIISNGSDSDRWRPLDTERHRVFAAQPGCRPCSFVSCPYQHECALAIGVEQVCEEALALLGAAH